VWSFDKTFNLGPMYVTVSTYTNQALNRESTGSSPVFFGPMFIHGHLDTDTFNTFFWKTCQQTATSGLPPTPSCPWRRDAMHKSLGFCFRGAALLAAQQAVRSDWKTADVDAQYIDVDRALLGYGDFVLWPKYVRHRRTLQDWGRMTACQRSKAVDLCYHLPARSNVVTSTDGRLTVSSAPSAGRKPYQRKCPAADRTLMVTKCSWETAAADRETSQPTERDSLNITSFWQNHLTYLCINIFSERERELTFTFAMLSSICLSSVCLFVVCRSSVTLDHPTQAVVIFCTFSMAFGTLAVDIHENFLRRSFQGNPSIGQRWA